MKPIDAVSWKRDMSISATPGGAVGCTSTGSALASIALQIVANAGSVSGWPSMLASTITPDAPAAMRALELGQRERSGYCHGSDANQRSRSGMRGARRRHVVVHDPRRLQAHLRTAPVAVRDT